MFQPPHSKFCHQLDQFWNSEIYTGNLAGLNRGQPGWDWVKFRFKTLLRLRLGLWLRLTKICHQFSEGLLKIDRSTFFKITILKYWNKSKSISDRLISKKSNSLVLFVLKWLASTIGFTKFVFSFNIISIIINKYVNQNL
jgi:hypothetical protein